jgi:Zn-dependent protease
MGDLLGGDPAAILQRLILQVPALLIAVTLHELAHALVADHLGDPTARLQGRITLNPLPHIDPLGALAFVIAGFGWAKPVPVNAYRLKNPRRDMAVVAVAGPITNFAVALVALIAYEILRRTMESSFLAKPILGVLLWSYVFNLGLGIFNLIPLPPLDGGHFLPYIFPRASWTLLHQLEQYGPFILILLVMTRATGYIMGPALALINGFYAAIVRFLFSF